MLLLLRPDKQKENEKLRETLAKRTTKLEQSRKECEALRQENSRLQERLEQSSQESSQLRDTLHYSKEELHRYTHTQSPTHWKPAHFIPQLGNMRVYH